MVGRSPVKLHSRANEYNRFILCLNGANPGCIYTVYLAGFANRVTCAHKRNGIMINRRFAFRHRAALIWQYLVHAVTLSSVAEGIYQKAS